MDSVDGIERKIDREKYKEKSRRNIKEE